MDFKERDPQLACSGLVGTEAAQHDGDMVEEEVEVSSGVGDRGLGWW